MMPSAYNTDHFMYAETGSTGLSVLQEVILVNVRLLIQPGFCTPYIIWPSSSKYNLKISAVKYLSEA